MAAKSKIKKTPLTVKLRGGGTMVATVNGKKAIPFTKQYESWKKMAESVSAEDMKMLHPTTQDLNLLKFTENSGVLSRIYVTKNMQSPKSKGQGGVRIIQELNKILVSKSDLKDEQIIFMENLITELEKHNLPSADTNPANIMFSDPVDLTPKGYIEKDEPVYGHYRTVNYQEWRSTKKDKDSKTFENVPAVDDDWYSYTKDGSARPPAWQILFAENANYKPFQHIGLLKVCKNNLEVLNNLEWNVDPSDPIPVTGSKVARKLYEGIDTIRDEVDSWATEGSDGLLNTNGFLYGNEASRALATVPIELDTNSEVKIIQELIGLGFDVDTIYLNVTPTQCKNMLNMSDKYKKYKREMTREQKVATNKKRRLTESRARVEAKENARKGKKKKEKSTGDK
tara:strand:+ start:1493 stop:2683 length:1191 start_codon:yes stop_codon:yes gene_type:complete